MNMLFSGARFPAYATAPGRTRRKKLARLLLPAFIALATAQASFAESEYLQRFHDIRSDIYNPANGYLSADGGPYHSVETLIVEAPDHGHQSTSEAYSYILLLEAVHGKLTGDWEPLRKAWDIIEEQIIPTDAMQPTANKYNPAAPATYIPESDQPSGYPGPLISNVAVGQDPVSAELAQTYGTWSVYGMHWLLDLDNTYGYGNFGDGVSTPSYVNTFQRGVQESVWETVTHPSWEDFSWGNSYGFLQLFVDEVAPAPQWRYTNAPDADARAVQVLYWALQWIRDQGKEPETVIPGLAAKASKMGDYLRLAMFDKYFKAMGATSESSPAGNGYDSAHYLMSWYYAWGGPIDTSQDWGFRIGSSHVHFGYQNPVAAYALSQVPELKPASPGGVRDWTTSLERSLEFYQWLQSREGAIAGGATNSWGGSYKPRPYQADFHGMTYDPNPVYHDPGSGTWFGWQVWSLERLAEYYYITGDSRANQIMDKWVQWALSPEVLEFRDGDVFVAGELSWSGLPENWNAANPQPNTDLSVTVVNRGQDVGVAHSLARTLMYYAAAEGRHDLAEHAASRNAAKQILDIMWTRHRTDKGVAIPETRGDYQRFNEPVYIPAGYNGVTATGGVLNQSTTFISQRPFYLQDPMYQEVLNAQAENRDPVFTYHRYWAQVEVAAANALYDELFISASDGGNSSSSSSSSSTAVSSISSVGSSSSSVVNSSSSAIGGQQCNWWGTLYPVCATTPDGWGWENNQSCIAAPTCSTLPPPYGLTDESDTGSSSSLSSTVSSNSSILSSSSSSSSSQVISSSSAAAVSACEYLVSNEWNNGLTGAIRITNQGTTPLNGWEVSWSYTDGTQITNSWNANLSGSNPYTASNLDWNGSVQPGQSVEFGFQATKGSGTAQQPVLTGSACQ